MWQSVSLRSRLMVNAACILPILFFTSCWYITWCNYTVKRWRERTYREQPTKHYYHHSVDEKEQNIWETGRLDTILPTVERQFVAVKGGEGAVVWERCNENEIWKLTSPFTTILEKSYWWQKLGEKMQDVLGICSKILSKIWFVSSSNIQPYLEEKDQNIHLNDQLFFKIAKISLQKHKFPGNKIPKFHILSMHADDK